MKFPFEETQNAIKGYMILTLLGAENFYTLLRRKYDIEFSGEEILGLNVLGRKHGELYIALDQHLLSKENGCDELRIIAFVTALRQKEEFAGTERPLVKHKIHVVLPHYCKGFKSYEYRAGEFDFVFETYQFDRLSDSLRDHYRALIDFDISKLDELHPEIKFRREAEATEDSLIAEFTNAVAEYKILVKRGSVPVPPMSHFKNDSMPGFVVLLERDGVTGQIGHAYELGFALERAWTAWQNLPAIEEMLGADDAPSAIGSKPFDQRACPECGGTDLVYGDLSGEKKHTKVFCSVACENCGKDWLLVYLPFNWQAAASN